MTCSSTAASAKFNPNSETLAIGVDMGGTSVKFGVWDGHTRAHREEYPDLRPPSIKTKGFGSALELIGAIAEVVRSIYQSLPKIKTVGMGVPGFVDAETGQVFNLTNVPGWGGIQLNQVLSHACGLPCVAENDANCMAWAEFCHYRSTEAGKKCKNMIGVTLGTGVGGGLVLNGQLFHGSYSGAGEIGQMSIDWEGRPGPYGNTGCLEKYIGNNETAARAQQIYARAGRSLPSFEPKYLSEAATAGDPQALQLWDEFTSQLASSMMNAIYLLNPDTIIIGGGVAEAGEEILFEPLRNKLNACLALPFRDRLKILKAHYGNDAGLIGAARAALHAMHS